ncbi:hypothetical protein ACWELQ_32855, partial [Nocardia sp. NPDC004722]
MNLAIDPRLIARLSTEFTSLSEHLNVLGRDLDTLHHQVIAENARTTTTYTTSPVIAPPVTGAPVPAITWPDPVVTGGPVSGPAADPTPT